MNRGTLYNLVEEKINDIFLEYQAANDIKSGDITPLQALQLEELKNKLTDLVMNVRSEWIWKATIQKSQKEKQKNYIAKEMMFIFVMINGNIGNFQQAMSIVAMPL